MIVVYSLKDTIVYSFKILGFLLSLRNSILAVPHQEFSEECISKLGLVLMKNW